MSPLKIQLDYAAESPLPLDVGSSRLLANCHGPPALSPAEATTALAEALSTPLSGPPLARHVVPGDRVVIAVPEWLPGGNPTLELLFQEVSSHLTSGGVDPDDISLLVAPSLSLLGDEGGHSGPPNLPASLADRTTRFCPDQAEETAYLLGDAHGEPLHLARQLVDADVVIAVEPFGYDAALGGRSPEGSLWPSFARPDRRLALARGLLANRLPTLRAWRALAGEVTSQLGLLASLRLTAGRGDSLGGLCFGFPADSRKRARQLAGGWRPAPTERAAVTVAGVASPHCSLATITRAVAAAARVTRPDGTICLATDLAAVPDGFFTNWRRGEPLQMVVGDAAGADDPAMLAEALQTLVFARALADRRLVLLANLDEETVENLDIGHADSPDAVNRLVRQADSLAVLHEADRLCPSR